MTELKKKRAHRATGKKRSDYPPAGGRPPGTKNILPMGAIKAIKALNMRQPKEMTEGQREILSKSEEMIVKVMEGKVHGSIATPVLKAAVTVREEIVGPISQKIDLNHKVGLFELLGEVGKLEQEEVAAEVKPAEPVVAKGPIIRKKAE